MAVWDVRTSNFMPDQDDKSSKGYITGKGNLEGNFEGVKEVPKLGIKRLKYVEVGENLWLVDVVPGWVSVRWKLGGISEIDKLM